MLWFPTLSKSDSAGFRSSILDTDEASTGKWLIPIPFPDIGNIWESLEDATTEGRLIAVKKSTEILRQKIGHDLVCVYCSASDAVTVAETLAIIRVLGIEEQIQYKSDRATDQRRNEYLWSSTDFELVLEPRPF